MQLAIHYFAYLYILIEYLYLYGNLTLNVYSPSFYDSYLIFGVHLQRVIYVCSHM